MTNVKHLVKAVLPGFVVRAVQRYTNRRRAARFARMSTREVFTRIYEEGVWGSSSDPAQRYYSGTGSHDPEVVGGYVDAVRRELMSFPEKPDVADLGCGDFSVGSKLRDLCGAYTACDIVEPLIQHNRERYRDLDVEFRVLDLANDPLPRADVAFIRQVLQHLSNAEIARVVPKLATTYRYLIVTEHLAGAPDFAPNRDHPTGSETRLSVNSGVDLVKPPFNLRVQEARTLCERPEFGGVVRTSLYRLA